MHRRPLLIALVAVLLCGFSLSAFAQSPPAGTAGIADEAEEKTGPGVREMIQAGGLVGYIIVGLSLTMVALIVEHILSIRRKTLMPPGLAEEVHRLIGEQKYQQADQSCRMNPSYLSRVLGAGLAEVSLGYSSVEKAMEDSGAEQSSRLFRKIEYLSVIGTIAPMLGLLGTVWGMILAFVEFESKANPQVSELAPGIYKALVTTLLGLGVAVPALAAFAIFRNRIDELIAEASLLAEQVFADFKRGTGRAARRRESQRRQRSAEAGLPPAIPSIDPEAQV
jgi:biopolymer transport protein ExbB